MGGWRHIEVKVGSTNTPMFWVMVMTELSSWKNSSNSVLGGTVSGRLRTGSTNGRWWSSWCASNKLAGLKGSSCRYHVPCNLSEWPGSSRWWTPFPPLKGWRCKASCWLGAELDISLFNCQSWCSSIPGCVQFNWLMLLQFRNSRS